MFFFHLINVGLNCGMLIKKKLELGFIVKNYIIIMLYNYSLSNYYNNIVINIDIINI